MTPQEAYSILEVDPDVSDEDLKKRYKELAKKYHPDISKEPETFKKINEAHQLVQDYRANPNKYQPQNSGGFWGGMVDLGEIILNASDLFGSGNENFVINASHIRVTIPITFHESVTGCSKEIKYKRNIKCHTCNGTGKSKQSNGCNHCDGFGTITNKQGPMIMRSRCNKCHGKNVKINKCETCKGKRTTEEERSGQINIPPGVQDDNILRLQQQGNFVGRNMFADSYTDVNLYLEVSPYKDLVLKDNDVHSTQIISLLEALEGTNKIVETVYGDKTITIKPLSKHAEQIKIHKCGVSGSDGNHIINLEVQYPTDITNIVGVLKNVVPDPV